jgi:hypothetical protein
MKPEICEHGSLKRQCLVCELQDDVTRLTADLEAARRELDELRSQIDGAACIIIAPQARTGRGADELRQALLRLPDGKYRLLKVEE